MSTAMRHGRIRAALTMVATAIVAAAVSACGLDPKEGSPRVSVTITREFGTRSVGSLTESHIPRAQTVVGLLEHSFRVVTQDRDRTVASIDGLTAVPNSLKWSLFVNGVKLGPRSLVHKGDRIWWDLNARASIPAVVGSFPEPFVHGSGGRRWPTVLECAADVTRACNSVATELHAIGVAVAQQAPGTGSGTDSLAVDVGTWNDLHASLAAAVLGEGPSASGVYAKFAPDGSSLELLNPRGQIVRVLGAGAGLIAATAQNGAPPTWLITGTDPAGVAAAAADLTAARLDRHFALATDGDVNLPLPQDGAS